VSGEQKNQGPLMKMKKVKAHSLPTAHCPPPTVNYIELHARSAFSFLEGASVPEELVAACQALEMPAMALLDRDGVYGSPRFHLAAEKNGIKAHIGSEITVQCPDKVQGPMSNVQCQNKDAAAGVGQGH
jgi:DNA polymerase III alpha subunit